MRCRKYWKLENIRVGSEKTGRKETLETEIIGNRDKLNCRKYWKMENKRLGNEKTGRT